MARRIKSHVLEQVIIYMMIVIGLAAVILYSTSFSSDVNFANVAILEIMMIVILAILAQTILLIRIYQKYE